jgi:chromosome segregation ATPase
MTKPVLKNIIMVLLIILTAFSVVRYSLSLKEKYDLIIVLNQVKDELDVLEQEKQNLLVDLEKEKGRQAELSEKNAELKDNIKATRRRLTKIFMEKREKEKTYEELSYRFSILQAEKVALLEEKDQLNAGLSQANSENEKLKVKLSSIQELKKAIRELKYKIRPLIVKPKKPKEIDEMIEGNRGYVIRDGKSTYPGKIRIEVRPASTAE